MTEASKDMAVQAKQNKLLLEYLDYYKQMVAELFSRNSDFLMPFLEPDSGPLKSCNELKDSKSRVTALFQEGMVTGISDFEREKLKGFLNEGITSLHQETDEILDGILATFRIGASIKGHLDSTACVEKQKILPCSSGKNFTLEAPDAKASLSCGEQVYADFQGYLQKGMQPKEALETCSNALLDKLGCVEHFLEEYLDTSLSKCRPMTNAEKQQLGQKIHKLPANALDRVAEIIQHRKPLLKDPSSKTIHVNLDEEDDVTLWRLYCYVETVAKAGKHKLGSHGQNMQFEK